MSTSSRCWKELSYMNHGPWNSCMKLAVRKDCWYSRKSQGSQRDQRVRKRMS